MNIRRVLFVVLSMIFLMLLVYPLYFLKDFQPSNSNNLVGPAKDLNTLGKHLAGIEVSDNVENILSKTEKITLSDGSALYQIKENGECWELNPIKTDTPYRIPC